MNKQLISKVSTVVISLATVASLSGFSALMPVAQASTMSDLAAQIASLQAQLAALQGSSSTTTTTTSTVSSTLLSSGNLTLGSTGAAVMELQKFLNANNAMVAASGAGSPGHETSYFGGLTKLALAKWQRDHNVDNAPGNFGPLTRAAMAALGSTTSSTNTTTTTTTTTNTAPVGTGLTVRLAADQPAPSLAPFGAARIPFTKVQLTASSDGDVTVTGLVVERDGLAQDSALSAVLLLDSNGGQVGIKKTLNSNHQATIGDTFVVKAGTTQTYTLAANRPSTAGTQGGQTLSLSLVGVNTLANLNATFPMVGATHTINETLTIGSVTMARGPLDPAASQTKSIGTTNYTFSSVKVTAGSTERVYLKSVRWNQTGSAGSGDLANVRTYVDGTAYNTAVSADGKYYTTTFPGSGLLMDKGASKEVYVNGDLNGGSSRTVAFDIAKLTDLGLVGETYGYGIVPPQSGASGTDASPNFTSSEDPWYDGGQVTVSSGTLTVSSWTGVQAQNISINLADQPLGGWTVEVKGEPVSVANQRFVLQIVDAAGHTAAMSDLTNLKLVDQTGRIVAGPIDASGTANNGTVTFTDTTTYPVGTTNLTLKGKLSTNFGNNDTVAASTTPSSGWTTVTGQTTGNTITPSPTSAVTSQTMTVKSAALTASVSSVPIAQTVIAGVNSFEFARYILDSSGSGEDLRLTSMPLEYNVAAGSATDLTNCKLYNGSALLNSSNVVNPSAAASSTSFIFDGTGLTLPKGTSLQLSLQCDLKASASGAYYFGLPTAAGNKMSATGLTSGQSATVTENGAIGQKMTAATGGSLTVTLDSNSPSYAIASPGQTVELARIKYSATNENITLKQVALRLTNAASNSPIDLTGQMVTLNTTDGTQVGTATFSSGDTATSSALSGFTVPKDGSKVLVIKGTIAGIAASGPLTASGDLVSVDYDGHNMGLNGNYGTGVASGSTIPSATTATSDTASNGVRVMKAYPTLTKIDLSSSERTLVGGDAKTLYKFQVTANNGDVALYKMSFSVSSSTAAGSNATTSKFGLYAFTDSGFSTADSNFNGANNPGGLVNAGTCYNGQVSNTTFVANGAGNLGSGSALVMIYADKTGCNKATTTLIVPSGSSRWFKLVGSVGTLASSGTSENIQVQMEGDAAYPTASLMAQAGAANSGVNSDANKDFIWSPVSTTTSNLPSDLDWTNGYGLIGLPSSNMNSETLSK